MKTPILFLLLATALTAHAQDFTIKEFKRTHNRIFFEDHAETITIKFPVIVTKSAVVNKLINDKIKEEVLSPEDNKMSLAKALDTAIGTWMTELEYEVTFRQNGLLSLKFTVEGEGAYPSTSLFYLNFDLRNGQFLTTLDIIAKDRIESFTRKVFTDKKKFLQDYKSEMKDSIKTNKNDTTDFASAIEIVNESCIEHVEMKSFSLTKNELEIIDPCEFPHVMQNMGPDYQLKYSLGYLKEFLKPEYLKRLIKQ